MTRRRKPTKLTTDEHNTYEKVFFPQYQYEIRAVQVVPCRKFMPPRKWFVYDVQKNKPILPNPVFEIRKSGVIYNLVDLSTNQIVFSDDRLQHVVKHADANVPPRNRKVNHDQCDPTPNQQPEQTNGETA